MKNEYYKARELGNEALKLCTDEYITYKGRILNLLASLYWEITTIDEHLDLLQQSLVCFEKAKDIRGILGVLNNIGVVYAERLQNNEEALSYFLKLKERSEESNYSEFNVFSYFNIGETYFKCLRYEEALYWCKLALKEAESAQMEGMVFYSYAILINVNVNLNNYEKVYHYFNLATEELESYPDQGVRLPWYYKSSARLFLEIGECNKAKHNIEQALNILGDDESIIKLDAGIVYEFIKLKEAKNKTEIIDALQGLRYILSKYKNPEVILDIVSDAALEIMNLGHRELAFNLVDEYKDIKTERQDTMLKCKYIEALRCSDKEKVLMLNSALDLALEIQNSKLQLRIYSSLGEYYLEANDNEKAKEYYVEACKLVKNIVISVPEEFRIQFINSNNFVKYLNLLAQVKQTYSQGSTHNYNKYHYINNEEELLEFFGELDNDMETL